MGERVGERLRSIPWAVIASHEAQALANHDQTLERLAQRGGLDPTEAVAVLQDRPWRWMDFKVADTLLRQIVARADGQSPT